MKPKRLFPKAYADLVARLRVPAGGLLLLITPLVGEPSSLSMWIGLGIAIPGLALRAWAAGCLEKNRTLTVAGPYRYVRNPLYLGSFLAGIGLATAANCLWLLVLWVGFFVGVYLPVIESEEEHLAELFPQYVDYAKQTPRLLPRLMVNDSSLAWPSCSFSWRRFCRNREHRGLGLWVVVYLLLVLKAKLVI